MKERFETIDPDGTNRVIELRGRDAWALKELIQAGSNGCNPMAHPGPRWSAYVHRLRHHFDLHIETIYEAHGGEFAGVHGVYFLCGDVRRLRND